MLTRLRSQAGTAGLIIAIVALVAALAGGAIAANSGGGNATASKKAKAKTGPRGKTGPAGPAGPAGLPGPQGLPGAAGAKGQDGSNGSNGKNGEPGKDGKDGEPGKDGEDGQDGTDGTNGTNGEAGMCSAENPSCTLGEGGLLTGIWSTNVGSGNSGPGNYEAGFAPISFPVRVSPAPEAAFPYPVEFFPGKGKAAVILGSAPEGEPPVFFGPNPAPFTEAAWEEDVEAFENACPGNFASPEAGQSGVLCIYPGPAEGAELTPGVGEPAHRFGIVLRFLSPYGNYGNQRGSWAVKG